MSSRVVILGAGPAGIAAAYTLKTLGIESIVYEKKNDFGGLCGGFWVGDYHFDYFAHMTFSKNSKVNELLEEKTECISHIPEAYNYHQGQWLRNPVQNNLIGLPAEERVKVITDFINRPVDIEPKNYKDWLLKSYGTYFTENFPSKYTRKYWTVEPELLETEWVKFRMYVPELEEILRGAMTEDTPNVHYSKEMHYPVNGGFRQFLVPLVDEIKIQYNKEIRGIDSENKKLHFADGTMENYDEIISTLPLTEMSHLLWDLPEKIDKAVEKLDYTSGYMVSVGLKRKIDFPSVWFYIYDEEILPARVYLTDKKSPDNAPEGCSGLQAEIYVSKYKKLDIEIDELKNLVIEQLLKLGLFEEDDIVISDIRFEKYANIMFTPNIYEARKCVRNYLDAKNIFTAGRFGEWDYLWLEQSLLSGIDAAEKLVEKINGRNSRDCK